MKNHRTIENILKSWGESKREVPPHGNVLKAEILSKIPARTVEIQSNSYNRLPWLSLAFTGMALFVFLINSVGYPGSFETMTSLQNESSGVTTKTLDIWKSPGYDLYNMPIPSGTGLPVSDSREFSKIGYDATLRTRNVNELINKVAITVRGFRGRVDTIQSTEKWGYVSFAVPKGELGSFRAEIENLVGARFYTEQINSENLLPQKQVIEENERQAQKNLADLKAERGQIVKIHNQNIYSYQNRIDSIDTEIAALNIEYRSATLQRQAEIISKINQLQIELDSLKSQVSTENDNYQSKIKGIDNQIKNTQKNLTTIEKQDTDLLENVATVNGSISLRWISLWEMTDVYVPGPLLAWILLGAALTAYAWHYRSDRIAYDYL